MFDFPVATTLYCALVGIVFLSAWLYYDRRERAWVERERLKTTFHCIRCDRLYTAREARELCPCPRCGYENMRLRF